MRPQAEAGRRGAGAPAIVVILIMVAQCATSPARPLLDETPPREAPPEQSATVQEGPREKVAAVGQEPREQIASARQEPQEPAEPAEEEYRWGEGNRQDDEERFSWQDVQPKRDDPTVTAGGTLSLFMRSRDYRTIRILKSVMTTSLQANYDRDSARFNGKQNVRLTAFHFEEEDFKPVHYSGGKGDRRATIYDAQVRSLWASQGELIEERLEIVRLTQEESGLWRVGRMTIETADRYRHEDQTPSVTSLRKLLRGWHRRRLEVARPYMSGSLLKRYEGRDDALQEFFAGDPLVRHAAFRILGIDWDEDASEATADVRFYFTERSRFGALEGILMRFDLTREGVSWHVDAWEPLEVSEFEKEDAGESVSAGV